MCLFKMSYLISDDFQIGEWVLVLYDGNRYPGVVNDTTLTDCKISVMQPTTIGYVIKYWIWPHQPDVIYYKMSDIIRSIEPPSVFGSRGQFEFTDNFIN